jgi:hypothetical protein
MAKKPVDTDAPAYCFKDETARQRWELFHRAIAHAKQSNLEALDDQESAAADPESSGPLLSIVP